jgi:hypothetical protein
MNASASIRNIIIVVGALALSIWLGISIVTDQTETIINGAGVALLITCIFLGRRIWLLLIFFSALNVPVIRGFGTTEIGQMLFIGFTVIITLMRRQPFKFNFGEKELWMLVFAGCVLQVYLRNPVGLNIFGAGNVGARPYFMVTITFLASMLLGNIVVSPSEIRWAFRLSIIGSLLGVFLGHLRSGIGGGPVAFEQGSQLDDGSGPARIAILSVLTVEIARIIASFISPLRALLHPFWVIIMLFCFVAAPLSGYRTTVATVGLIMILGIAYRSGGLATFGSLLAGATGLGLLAFVNLVNPLPGNIQRALSPFPGTWEKKHTEGADESTKWRVDMWKEALFTDYWIKNKILGDGLGFTRAELTMMEDLKSGAGGGNLDSRNSGMTRQQEAMMVTGGYHSGPVQTVRIVGYVGLLVLVLFMIRMAMHAHRQILRCRGTEWFPISLYCGIPVIALPPVFILVFGDFARDASAVLFSYGMISLLEKNLPLPPYMKPRRTPYLLIKQSPNKLADKNAFAQ